MKVILMVLMKKIVVKSKQPNLDPKMIHPYIHLEYDQFCLIKGLKFAKKLYQ